MKNNNPKSPSSPASKTSPKEVGGLPLLGKNMVLPVPNPTGNPYDRPHTAKINDEVELKGLQVKAELDKLGAPSRSFSEYLLLETGAANDNQMQDCEALGTDKKMSLSERFGKIERARPAVPPITI